MEVARRAAEAALQLATLSTGSKNEALGKMAEALWEGKDQILAANEVDVERATSSGLTKALVDRLTLNEKRIQGVIAGLNVVKDFLPDPVGEVIGGWRRPNGLEIIKKRVPLGVVGIIYEARPNVTVDVIGLCLKSGNAVVLRGGSDALNSNKAIVEILGKALRGTKIPEGSFGLVESLDRAAVKELLKMKEYIDVIIPRGGPELINMVKENSLIPVIETGAGNCHVFVEASADQDMAEKIVENAKCQRPSVCNAAETLLVDEGIAAEFIPRIVRRLTEAGVDLRGCPKTRKIMPSVKAATEEDWGKEYLDLVMAVKVVEGLEEAVKHINKYSTRHTEAIVTRDFEAARRFTEKVASSTVMVNASTRFTDGGEFGFGAEIGISNQKLHARGPMGLLELTTYKYIVLGNGQIRE